MRNWDDYKNDIIPVPEPTSAGKPQRKKRRAKAPPSASPSRTPSPPNVPCDRAFVVLVKQLFHDFVKTPQMQRWLANLFSTVMCIERPNTVPLTSRRSGSDKPLIDSTNISVKRSNLDLSAVNMNPAKTKAFLVLCEHNYDYLCNDETMTEQFVQFCLENFEEQTDQLLDQAVEAWSHRLGCITEQESVRAIQAESAPSHVPEVHPRLVEQKKAWSVQTKYDPAKAPQDSQRPELQDYYMWQQKEGSRWNQNSADDDENWGYWHNQ